MKIAWFTPFSKKSAIGRCSQGIVEELVKRAQVDLFHFDADESYASKAVVRRFSSHEQVDAKMLSRYDLVFYNFGNHLPFHRDIYEVSRRRPGYCVLHDFVVQHFFAAYYLEYLKDPDGYIHLMQRLYGPAGFSAATDSLAGNRIWESDDAVNFPLFEELVRGAEGVITHSDFFKRHVERAFPGPVAMMPLPYEVDLSAPVLPRSDLGVPKDHNLIVTIGHVNPNKRITATIAALGSIRVDVPFTFAILGSCGADYRREVESAIRQNQLEDRVKLLGQVSDEALRSYLANADLCINLRFPVFEGASASAIEEMLYSKPVIVSDLGFYAELPDECVVKVDPRSEEQLAQVFQRLLSKTGEPERLRLGKAAGQYAASRFRADLYARAVVDFAAEAGRAKPLLGLADRVAIELNRMGVAPDMKIVDEIPDVLDGLFCRGPKGSPAKGY